MFLDCSAVSFIRVNFHFNCWFFIAWSWILSWLYLILIYVLLFELQKTRAMIQSDKINCITQAKWMLLFSNAYTFHNLLLVSSILCSNVHVINLLRLRAFLDRKTFVRYVIISVKAFKVVKINDLVDVLSSWYSELILPWKINFVLRFSHLWWSQHFSHI